MNLTNKITFAATGIGFSGFLCLLFIALKLSGIISWSWFWVVIPITWWALLIGAILFLIVVAYGGLWLAAKISTSASNLKIKIFGSASQPKLTSETKLSPWVKK